MIWLAERALSIEISFNISRAKGEALESEVLKDGKSKSKNEHFCGSSIKPVCGLNFNLSMLYPHISSIT